MKRLVAGVITVLTAWFASNWATAAPLGTGFTYQGRLTSTIGAAPSSADFVFTLHDMLNGGAQVAGPLAISNVGVANGLFTVEIDFGSTVFDGQARWLGIQVRAPAGSGGYTPLAPRQPMTATPYALQTRGLFVDNANQLGIGTTAPLSPLHLWGASPQLRIQDNDDPLSYALLQDLQPTLFRITKVTNSGTAQLDLNPSPADAVSAATLRVFRETNTTGATRVLFHRGDGTATIDAQIGVKGTDTYFNGGDVGIGTTNPTARLSVIGGSLLVARSGPDPVATFQNSSNNLVSATTSIGQVAVQSRAQTGLGLPVESQLILEAESTTGIGQNVVRIRAENRPLQVLAGGTLELYANGARCLRVVPTVSTPNWIAGDATNAITNGSAGTVGGGTGNQVTDSYCTVGGGQNNRAGTAPPQAPGILHATVAGGSSNVASHQHATVGGGQQNTAQGSGATVAGGENNTATGGNLGLATVGGGSGNQASGLGATISGGVSNTAAGIRSSISGGLSNSASGDGSMIPGGQSNAATGATSFAAGNRAKANHSGAFVWGDFSGSDVTSSAANQFTARASGGVRFFTNSALTNGVTLAANGGAWASLSDRNAKDDFCPVNARNVLEYVAALSIQTWRYKGQPETVRHIGPVAQDFHAAFGFGEDDRHISTIDADGVALAAIQGLRELVREKEHDITVLKSQKAIQDEHIADLNVRLARMETLVVALVENAKGDDR